MPFWRIVFDGGSPTMDLAATNMHKPLLLGLIYT